MTATARRPRDNTTSSALYDSVAQEAVGVVITRYSSSFSSGARLLARAHRRHIANVYSLVRLADEVVDTYRGPDAGTLLDELEAETHAALQRGYSANIVVHAFALTARAHGITAELTAPFFASMRMDLATALHTPASFEQYVFGSAEVVGEMCLRVFLDGAEPPPAAVEGARRLGSAYQKVNFLRDLAADHGDLGRNYFPGVDPGSLDDATVARLVDDCAEDLAAARAALPLLPPRPRRAVRTTLEIYTNLLRRISSTPASELMRRRIRVPGPMKAILAARAALTTSVGR